MSIYVTRCRRKMVRCRGQLTSWRWLYSMWFLSEFDIINYTYSYYESFLPKKKTESRVWHHSRRQTKARYHARCSPANHFFQLNMANNLQSVCLLVHYESRWYQKHSTKRLKTLPNIFPKVLQESSTLESMEYAR